MSVGRKVCEGQDIFEMGEKNQNTTKNKALWLELLNPYLRKALNALNVSRIKCENLCCLTLFCLSCETYSGEM